MMATMSGTWKNKPDNQNLTRSRSLGPKPKQVPSSEPESNTNGSGRKIVEKPLPNYLKPTVSSRPDPVKFLRKNKAVEDNQKLLRRRSFDRPLSSSLSTHKSLNSPQARPRERPVVPREKTGTSLRSTSFHGSSRGSTTIKSPPVASRGPSGVKKSGLSGTSASKSRKEGSENVSKRSSGKEITPECSPPEDVEEIAQLDKSTEEEEKGELINEEQTEEEKETENTRKDKEEVDDEEESSEAVKEEEISNSLEAAEVKEETNGHVGERTKKEVVKGKKGSPTAYNDVIASKMQESSRKNKVLALAGAFQTVIDYETAACNK